jgi:hypothetical protein
MKALLAFSGGGGGSGFPGAPVAGVYTTATAPEFLSVCAEVVAVTLSTVVDGASGGLIWYSNGSQIILAGGSVIDSSEFPTPGTAGGVVFSVPIGTVAIYNIDTGHFYYFDGVNWIDIGGL